MAIRAKIDSNETNCYYAEEATIGVLPVTPDWRPLEPNSYDDFGGEVTLTARNPINSGRQRKKGRPTDLDASGGLEQDMTLENSPDILQGFMFASLRKKPIVAVTSTTSGFYEVADETGFIPSQLIFASGFDTASLNGLKKVAGTNDGQVGVTSLAAASETGFIQVVGFEGDATDFAITSSGGTVKLTSGDLDFTDLGLTGGEWIFIGGDATGTQFATAGNNGFKRIRNITSAALTIDQSDTVMAADAGTGKTIRFFLGDVLKNEVGSLIVRRSYNLERQLGAPDTAQPSQVQSEYVIGAIANELELAIDTADKIMLTMGFMGLTNETRTGATGVKTGNRHELVEADMFNTSSDFASIRMSIIDPANNSPTALFAYVTDMKVTINNNAEVSKAVGVLGGFDVSVGTFEVAATATAYFSTVAAIDAVKASRDVQLYSAVAFANQGFVFDLPLLALGGGRLDIEQDTAIMVPLTADAATAAKLSGDLNHTLLWVFYKYLPTLANS